MKNREDMVDEVLRLLRRGDVIISRSGTQRRVIEMNVHPELEGGGSIKTMVSRGGGNIPKKEYISFKEFLSAHREGAIKEITRG
ncbi:MAG: hypothetical protein NUV53_02610 [Patescibacteria group bacterium]|nr:hypothetical protein [Patescibacteria group bacterium]